MVSFKKKKKKHLGKIFPHLIHKSDFLVSDKAIIIAWVCASTCFSCLIFSQLEILDLTVVVKSKPLNTVFFLFIFFFFRTDHSSKLRVCTNQQALYIGPVPAAGCAGAAETAAAAPSEPQSCSQPIAAHRNRFHLHHLVSLKGSEYQSLTPALQSSGPMPPCSAPPQCL